MRVSKTVRWFLLFLLFPMFVSTTARAGVFISVGVAPPPLPVYVQPPCPEPDLMWVPGYWAYDYDAQSYYWVPGAWVPAPYEGALWTPPYWGWDEGVYMFHPGYWGYHVGYYGGVNYGYGYMGVGFVGGEWHEHRFAYNTAVVNVNRTVIHNTYINQTIVQNNTIINNNHIAYAGGPGGVRHDPTPEERVAMHEQHVAPTHFQQQHIQQARSERANFFNVNHGHPQTVALARPLPPAHVAPPPAPVASVGARPGGTMQSGRTNGNGDMRPRPQQPESQVRPAQPQPTNGPAPVYQAQRPQPTYQQQQQRPEPQYRPAPEQPRYQPPQQRPQPNYQPQNKPSPEQPRYQAPPQQRSQQEYRPAPQPRPEQQYHPAPEPRPEPQSRPAPQARPQPQEHTAPQPRNEPAPRDREHR